MAFRYRCPHLTLTEIFYFRHCREGQSRHGLEGTTLSRGLKEMVVEKGEAKCRKSYTWEETSRANDKNSFCQTRQNLTSYRVFTSVILQKNGVPRGSILAEGRDVSENWALYYVLFSCCSAEELPKATARKFPVTLQPERCFLVKARALLRIICGVLRHHYCVCHQQTLANLISVCNSAKNPQFLCVLSHVCNTECGEYETIQQFELHNM